MPPIARENNLLEYQGSNFLKQRLVLSTLSGKPVRIVDIRKNDLEPGLRESEISLIRLFDKITNGTEIELNKTGTSLLYKPGLLSGGVIQHDCCIQRGIGYYLDVLIAVGPFCKNPINATLRPDPNVSAPFRSDQLSKLKFDGCLGNIWPLGKVVPMARTDRIGTEELVKVLVRNVPCELWCRSLFTKNCQITRVLL